ncbi:MAG: UPF0175 family protein [Candidatus Altiarchaeales archaeon]|nr:UPF0175 family protein [Candidatus Altiarchaeales archaeon]
MTDVPVSARIPTALERDLERFMKQERLEKSVAVRKILYLGLREWKQERALRLLEQGKVTVARAAEIADLDIWEFLDVLRKSDKIWVKVSSERMRGDIKAAVES